MNILIAKQESNEIRRIIRSQAIGIEWVERPKADSTEGGAAATESRRRVGRFGTFVDPDFLTHQTHESNEIKGASGRRSACSANFASFRVFSGPASGRIP